MIGEMLRVLGGGSGGGTTVIDAGSATDVCLFAAAAIVDSNQPDAVTELLGNLNRRTPAYLQGRTEIIPYVAGTVSGDTGSVLLFRWSLDNGETWNDFGGVADVSIVSLAAGTSVTIGTAATIPAEAQGPVLIGIFTDGGATITDDPAYTRIGFILR